MKEIINEIGYELEMLKNDKHYPIDIDKCLQLLKKLKEQ